jgi:hypothetical protein
LAQACAQVGQELLGGLEVQVQAFLNLLGPLAGVERRIRRGGVGCARVVFTRWKSCS